MEIVAGIRGLRCEIEAIPEILPLLPLRASCFAPLFSRFTPCAGISCIPREKHQTDPYENRRPDQATDVESQIHFVQQEQKTETDEQHSWKQAVVRSAPRQDQSADTDEHCRQPESREKSEKRERRENVQRVDQQTE